MTSPAERRAIPPEALFVVSAVSQYVGASIAVGLFERVEPATVAWFRVVGAAIALLVFSRGVGQNWDRRSLAGVAVFGVATAAMNLFFYLAINHIDLGKGVAIEFIGPIAVAAVLTRTMRNAAALVLTMAGVVTLGGVEIGENTIGVVYILIASALWAAYILFGSRVALGGEGLTGLGVGLAIGAVAIAPAGIGGSGPVWGDVTLLLLCCATGVFSNAIGYGIDQFVLRRIPVRRFSLLLATLPVTAVVIGWIALDQQPSGLDAVGIALVLLGVAAQERDIVDTEPTAAS